MDAGAEHPFSLHRAVELGTTGIIGVDVGSGKEGRPDRVLAQGVLAIQMRVFSMVSWRKRTGLVAHWKEPPPLLFVRPRLDGFQAFDFDQVQYILEEGYRATRMALLGEGPNRHSENP